ncbi:deubiquitinase OTUD6B [Chelonus insularis]|uniref:deubiquitinase OTUD6B n=1 Tax=Chelonus insularis TaxID=460826 RepID=UPI00158E6598|nr:deubiquitinase OTUD6B [Chelonus insularis]
MAEDDENTEEFLLQKHKKERKELQGRIQVLKKSICKGDKKKKKEISEEISRLESELDQQQEEELTNFKLSQLTVTGLPTETVILPENDDNDESSKTISAQRVSKAQKRRDKKANAEKERNRQIIEQEALNVFGKRNVETQTIKKILEGRDLMIYEIPSDGHCLYNAIAHQLKTNGEIPLSLQDLREKTAMYLRENMNDFLPFLSNSDSEEIFSPEQYEKYCDDVASTSAWGGAVELEVLSRVLRCPIEVIQATGTPYIIGPEYTDHKKVILTYHRHMYELGAHYNSVTKFVKEEDS